MFDKISQTLKDYRKVNEISENDEIMSILSVDAVSLADGDIGYSQLVSKTNSFWKTNQRLIDQKAKKQRKEAINIGSKLLTKDEILDEINNYIKTTTKHFHLKLDDYSIIIFELMLNQIKVLAKKPKTTAIS